ncbi:MAG: 7-cyano-7-deazaguanine synthase [Deltaproteobacteria bacterium]|nr:7-cyano-7-deazaguanine synthase [Deltaproteobacteria bacterium]
MPNSACALLFSGGTDSTCAAALAAESFSEIHLLTFSEHATRYSPVPTARVRELQAAFTKNRFQQVILSNDRVLRYLCYHGYLRSVLQFGFYNLATPGLSSLSWHLLTIHYCLQHRIKVVQDGLTRELMHFPGHMDFFVAKLKCLYAEHDLRYENPVREWPTPYDQQFLDRLLVDYRGVPPAKPGSPTGTTTGDYLHKLGLSPAKNIKGTRLDHLTQHDCYPFVLYNILCFWLMENLFGFESFEEGLKRFFETKFQLARVLLEKKRHSKLFELVEP